MTLELLREQETVDVLKGTVLAGGLSRTAHGALFRYDSLFRQAQLESGSFGIAYTLSPTQEEHEISGSNLHPFFAGLLPEGMRLKALRQSLKTSEDDLFTMLLALGTNCIGDVSVAPKARSGHSPEADEAEDDFQVESWDKVSFHELFEQSITSKAPSLREIDSGIPGVIPKISASMVSFPLSMKKRNKEYILKLETKEHPRLLQNEHYFMRMCAACGFSVAPTSLVQDRNGENGLLIERFDRSYDRTTGTLHRLHQEDACQFLGRYPQDKYRLSLKEIAEGVERLGTSPIVELRRLIELYVFSYLIGNGDLHAKNVSLLVDRDGRIRLSPVYDVLSTLPYGDRSMALKLGGKDDNFTIKDIVAFAKSFQVPARAVESSVNKILKTTAQWIQRISEIGLGEKKAKDILETYQKRSSRLLPP